MLLRLPLVEKRHPRSWFLILYPTSDATLHDYAMIGYYRHEYEDDDEPAFGERR